MEGRGVARWCIGPLGGGRVAFCWTVGIRAGIPAVGRPPKDLGVVMTYAIRLYEHGGPEVLRWERVDVGLPRPGELLVRQMAAGVNFMDIRSGRGARRSRSNCQPAWGTRPPGLSRRWEIGVTDFAVGDRIAYAGGGAGAYAETRLVPARFAIKLPNDVGCRQAAAMMLKGMTAQVVVKQIAKSKAGDTVLFHAASSGVGVIACQWLKHLGVKVIGTVGSDEKASATPRERLRSRHRLH